MALNTICRCAFGIDADALRNPDNHLVKDGKGVFGDFTPKSLMEDCMVQIINYFPKLVKYLPITPKAYDNLRETTQDIMRERNQAGITGNDFIARLMDLIESKKVINNYNTFNKC